MSAETAAETTRAPRAPRRLDVPAVLVFLVVTGGAGWLLAIPLLVGGRGLRTEGAGAILLAVMLAPTLGVLAATALRRRWSGLAHATGLRTEGGIRSWWRWGLLAWLAPPVLAVLALALAAALGLYHPDLVGFSGFAATLHRAGAGAVPVSLVVAAQPVQILVVGWLNVVPALAEEWGWRGWLLPSLLPLGRWPAILLVGVVWGLWHTPLLVLGYNYPLEPAGLRILLMIGFCVATGTLLGWLRLRSRSVWPCAIGHGFVNAVAGLPAVLATAGVPIDNATTGLLGWTGWLVCLLALALVAALLRVRGRTPQAQPAGAGAER